MTTFIRKAVLGAIAAVTLSAAVQPAFAGGNGFNPVLLNPGVLKPGVVKPGVHLPHFPQPGVIKPGIGKKPPVIANPHPKPHHNNDVAAAAALGIIGGLIIGGAIANAQAPQPVYQEPVYVGSGNAHAGWCLNRYRSYDVASDTYMSHSGYRKYCNSPYN